jgi:hypothetical protein
VPDRRERHRNRYYDRQGEPINMMQWARRFGADDRQVVETIVGEVRISTVWIGLDHDFSGVGPPLIFETTVFAGPQDQLMDRYSTEAQALAGHD